MAITENRNKEFYQSEIVPSGEQVSGATLVALQDDDDDLPENIRGFLLSAEATIKYNDGAGETHTFTFPVGYHAIYVSRIWENGTDDLSAIMLALY